MIEPILRMRPSTWLLIPALSVGAISGWAGDEAPALQVRLSTPIHSGQSRAGDPIEAVVTAPFLAPDGALRIAPGARVVGKIAEVRAVGLGLRRERARLLFEFHALDVSGWGDMVPLRAVRLASIDNSRESVSPRGEVRGIIAADNAHTYFRGLWFRPHGGMFHRGALGMTGLTSRLPVGPLGSVAIMGLRCLALRLPEPEINLPAGTDLELAVEPETLAALPDGETPLPPAALESPASEWLARYPHVTEKPDGKAAQDVINVLAIGSAAEIENAFLASGWSTTDRMTARSFGRAYKAYTTQHGYPTAPVSRLLFMGREPEMVFQKGFNTLSKRHHVRFWRVELPGGEEAWMGAGTHDTGVIFDRARFSVTHEIDPRIDRERERIVWDLVFAGCAGRLASVDRPALPVEPGVTTDGRLAVVRLNACQPPPAEPALFASSHPRLAATRSVLYRAARRLTLETRQYMLRGNVYYYAYRMARSGFRSPKPKRHPGEVVAASSAAALKGAPPMPR